MRAKPPVLDSQLGCRCAAEGLKQALKEPPATHPDPGFCSDTDKRCAKWAAAGECDNNPTYMTGGQFTHGACRQACNACVPCASSSLPCYAENRERAGFLDLFDEIRSLTMH